MQIVFVAVVAAVALAGCGGGSSDEDQIRDTTRQLAKDARAHHWSDFCATTTNPDDCASTLAGLKAVGIDAADYIPSDEIADRMKVTVDGDHATVDATAGTDAEYVRRDGEWLFVWTSG